MSIKLMINQSSFRLLEKKYPFWHRRRRDLQ